MVEAFLGQSFVVVKWLLLILSNKQKTFILQGEKMKDKEIVINMEDNRNRFVEIYNNNIKRDGAKEFLDFLMTTDFFEAPASSRFHSAVPGGLCFHSLNVYDRFRKKLNDEFNGSSPLSEESIALIALLHDVCKVNCYKLDFRNVKVDGEWTKVPYYAYADDHLPYGHGEKSVYMISGFMKLSREEAMAINWHMGGFDKRVLGGSYDLSSAFYLYPTACILHSCDMEATYLDESAPKN